MQQRYSSQYNRRLLLLLQSLWALVLVTSSKPLHSGIARRAHVQRQREFAIDQILRDTARRSPSSAPPTFSATLRLTLTNLTIAPLPSQSPPPTSLTNRVLTALWSSPWIAPRYSWLSEEQRRMALRRAGALTIALLFGGLGLALAPAEVVTVLGLAGALVIATLSLGHLLVAAIGAVMGNIVVACIALLIYAALVALWVRLVRHPVEA